MCFTSEAVNKRKRFSSQRCRYENSVKREKGFDYILSHHDAFIAGKKQVGVGIFLEILGAAALLRGVRVVQLLKKNGGSASAAFKESPYQATRAGHAARSDGVAPGTDPHAAWGVPGVVAMKMKTSFMQAHQGRLRAVAQVLHRTAAQEVHRPAPVHRSVLKSEAARHGSPAGRQTCAWRSAR